MEEEETGGGEKPRNPQHAHPATSPDGVTATITRHRSGAASQEVSAGAMSELWLMPVEMVLRRVCVSVRKARVGIREGVAGWSENWKGSDGEVMVGVDL
jgi:hypothetical protein